jgi:hypothetical protein
MINSITQEESKTLMSDQKKNGEQRGEEVKWVDFASWLETYVFDR